MTSRQFFIHVWRVAVAASLVCGALCACGGREDYRHAEGMVWNTVYNMTYKADTEYTDSILAVLAQVEQSVSVFTPGSVVCRVNSGQTTQIDSVFASVYRTSQRVWRESGGYFDPTLSPLIGAWGFEGKVAAGGDPDAGVIDSIMQFVGMDRTSLADGMIVKADPRTRFNFSAIAKGYGCDAVGRMLRRNGCTDYLVEIGGEIAVGGKAPSGDKWHIQVDKPVMSADSSVLHEAQTVLALTDCGVASSGNYRNYRRAASGGLIGHTIDPHTGRPAANDMLAATVVASTCMEADAYATACMAMGFDRAKEMVEKLGLKALLVAGSGRVWMSDSFRQLVAEP